MERSTLPARLPRHLVRWTIGDLVLALLFSAFVAGALIVALGLGLGALAGDPRALLDDNIVVFSAVVGILAYGILFLGVYLFVVRRRQVGWSALGFRPPPLLALVLAPLIAIIQLGAAAAVNAAILALTGQFENPQLEAISGGQGFAWTNFVIMLVLVGGVAPVVEETVFRGVLYGRLRTRMPLVAAVLVSAAVFSLAHVIPILLPALFVVGIILALAYELSGSLWLSILLHSLQNSLAVIVIFAQLALGLPLQT
jgi:membrane protease YdiL (CAAX protease family)